MAQGMSNAAACRIVGVNRKTGHRWRYGRSITNRVGEILTYPSITRPARAVSVRFLSEAERITIADGLIHGRSIRALAGELGRAPSTVSREIRRNRNAATSADSELAALHDDRRLPNIEGTRVNECSGGVG